MRVRCSRKKKMGRDSCTFKNPRLERIIEAVTEKVRNHFLTEDTLERVIAGVAEESKRYLEEQETSSSGISARMKSTRSDLS